MIQERYSFEEWLAKQGVVAKTETVDDSPFCESSILLSYIFNHEELANAFMEKFQVETHCFQDLLHKKYAVLINQSCHQKIIKAYEQETLKTRSEKSLREQLFAVNQRIEFFKNNSRVTSRLNDLQKLARNLNLLLRCDFRITSAYLQSLENFFALNQHLMNADEIEALKNHIALLHQDRDGWSNHLSTELHRIYDYFHDTYGVKLFPSSIQNKLRQAAAAVVEGRASSNGLPRRKRFFPLGGKSETDEIYLNTGRRRDHTTITKIWKRGVDASGIPISKELAPHHYEFYETEYNSGALAEPFEDSAKIIWNKTTRQIMPHGSGQFAKIQNPVMYHQAMHASIINLIQAEYMLKQFMCDDPRWQEWNRLRDSYLGPRIDALSSKGYAQRSNNCTLMCWKVLSDDHLRNLSEEHFFHAKQFNKNTTLQALHACKAQLEQSLADLGVSFANTRSNSKDEHCLNIFKFLFFTPRSPSHSKKEFPPQTNIRLQA